MNYKNVANTVELEIETLYNIIAKVLREGAAGGDTWDDIDEGMDTILTEIGKANGEGSWITAALLLEDANRGQVIEILDEFMHFYRSNPRVEEVDGDEEN